MAEARKLGIPVVAVVDSNNDPELIDVVVPGNDDATRAIKVYAQCVADAIIEGRGSNTVAPREEAAESAAAEERGARRPRGPRRPAGRGAEKTEG